MLNPGMVDRLRAVAKAANEVLECDSVYGTITEIPNDVLAELRQAIDHLQPGDLEEVAA